MLRLELRYRRVSQLAVFRGTGGVHSLASANSAFSAGNLVESVVGASGSQIVVLEPLPPVDQPSWTRCAGARNSSHRSQMIVGPIGTLSSAALTLITLGLV